VARYKVRKSEEGCPKEVQSVVGHSRKKTSKTKRRAHSKSPVLCDVCCGGRFQQLSTDQESGKASGKTKSCELTEKCGHQCAGLARVSRAQWSYRCVRRGCVTRTVVMVPDGRGQYDCRRK
jgi:hypothetical protein